MSTSDHAVAPPNANRADSIDGPPIRLRRRSLDLRVLDAVRCNASPDRPDPVDRELAFIPVEVALNQLVAHCEVHLAECESPSEARRALCNRLPSPEVRALHDDIDQTRPSDLMLTVWTASGVFAVNSGRADEPARPVDGSRFRDPRVKTVA